MTTQKKHYHTDLRRLRRIVAELQLNGSCAVAAVARKLGTSPRSLQRHLSQQGLSFRQLLDASRLEIARALLIETDLSVRTIAVRVGYSSPSGFARAFMRWCGMSPTAYRRATRQTKGL